VTNIALDAENAAIIRQGNERVLRARFNDARFFWEFDQRTPLVERVRLLENVTFHKELGSYAKKSERVLAISRILAELTESRNVVVHVNALMDAARLAKTDLTTELVKEFTELQGVIGGLYFKVEAEKDPRLAPEKERVEVTWQAIYDQYLPASAKDSIPRSIEGAILGIADRIDTISGMFSLGMEPTGSKDPFALRRAANAVVRILAESSLPLKLSEVIKASTPLPEVEAKINAFFVERIDFYLREAKGQAYDVAKAVMVADSDDLRDLVARAEALTAVRGSEDFLAVSAAFKRMKNILTQAREKGDVPNKGPLGGVLYPAEQSLMDAAEKVRLEVNRYAAYKNYVSAFESIATLRPHVDQYFQDVMILDPNPSVREMRLLLLSVIVSDIRQIADISEIVTAG